MLEIMWCHRQGALDRRRIHKPNMAALALALTLPALAAVQPQAQPQTGPAATPQSETARLNAWLDEVFKAELAHSPQLQTQLGMIQDLAAYGRWDDSSDAAVRATLERQQRYLAEMRKRFDYERLDASGQTTYRFFEFQSEMDARLFAVRESAFVFSPMLDAISGLTTFLINNHRITEPAHAEAYISRLRSIDQVIDTLVARAERRAKAGVQLPRFAYPRLIAAAREQIAGAPFEPKADDGALLADFRAKVSKLNVPADRQRALIRDAEQALAGVYRPAIQRYIASLEALEPHAPVQTGAWRLPDGATFYATQVAYFTTRDDLPPGKIHAIGLTEVERIQNEMRTIMSRVGFEGTLQEFFEYLRTDDRFYYPDTPEGRQAYLDESTRLIERVMAAAPKFFNRMPKAPLEVRTVEPFRQDTAAFAFYEQPALDGSRPGYYYVNLRSMRDSPKYLMESLAYHEGAPGHHFQIALAQELQDLPLIQRLVFFSAFVEGWALYAEHLGKDMGFFEDPYMDFGRLSYELFRAVRLVVDTGIHDQQWTRERAIAYMLQNTPMTEGDITPEVERYIVWPAQALSYKIGMNTILELRQRARAELGERFTWGGFHDAVLTAGSVPLPLLEERVNRWIASVRGSRERDLALGEAVALHRAILTATGGAEAIRDPGALESALAQPNATFDNTTSTPRSWTRPVPWPLGSR
jgi:uncharacterized protein (DUF885 family)